MDAWRSRSRRGLVSAGAGARMGLADWGLTPARLVSLSPAEQAAYEAAIAEYDAAVREVGMPWTHFRGLLNAPPPDGIRTFAQAIREVEYLRAQAPKSSDPV